MRPVSCDKYLELLSARLDGALTELEERELEAHLESCPACRAAGAQLAALQTAFAELEDLPAPEGFTREVMDRVRAADKAVPLFRRPLFKALAGLAACAVLAAGLYGAVSSSRQDADLLLRGVTQDALEEDGDVPVCVDMRITSGFSTTAAKPDMDAPSEAAENLPSEMQKAASDATVDYDTAAALPAAPMSDTEILVVDRMPEGGWELVPSAVSGDGLYVTGELLDQIEKMAQEQGITACLTSGTEEAELHLIVVLEESG